MSLRPFHTSSCRSLLGGAVAAQPTTPLPLLHDDPMVARLDDLAALPWVKNSP